MKSNPQTSFIFLALCGITVCSMHSHAVEVTKSATGTDLAISTSWGGSAPTSVDTARWATDSLGAGLTLDSVASWGGIVVTNATSAVDVTGSGTLTLGADGINLAGSLVDLSVGNNITLGADQSWRANVGRSIAISGNVSGSASLNFGELATSVTSNTFLTNTAEPLFTGVTLANVTATSGVMDGAWVAGSIVGNGHLLTPGAGTLTYWLEIQEGAYTKGVQIELVQSGSDVTARALSAKFVTPLQPLGYDFNTSGTVGTLATSVNANGYGASSTTLQFGENAAGTIMLSGANNYTGSTTIAAGTLVISGGSAIPDTSEVNINGVGTLQLNSNEVIGSLTGVAGSIVNLGANTITTGANDSSTNYGGSFTSSSGTITKTGSGVMTVTGTVSGSLASINVNNGVLVLQRAFNFDEANGWGGGSAATITGIESSLRLAAEFTSGYNRAFTIDGGSLNITSGTFIDGLNYVNNLTLKNDAIVVGNAMRLGYFTDAVISVDGTAASSITSNVTMVNNTANIKTATFIVSDVTASSEVDLTIFGAVRDFNTTTFAGTPVVKSGEGTLLMDGTNTYLGMTTVEAGILAGTGSAGSDFIVKNGATLSPGNEIGIMNTKQVTFESGSTFKVEIDSSSTSADQLKVNGNVSLTDCSATFTEVGSGTVPGGTKLVILDYTGYALTGTFSGLAEGATVTVGANSYTLRYSDLSRVTLTTAGGGYSGWASINGITGELFGADFDGDGLSNGMEYALGSVPTAFSAQSVLTPAGTDYTLTYQKGVEAASDPKISYKFETSSNLTLWTQVDPTVENSTTVSYTLPGNASPSFVRLKVVQQP